MQSMPTSGILRERNDSMLSEFLKGQNKKKLETVEMQI